ADDDLGVVLVPAGVEDAANGEVRRHGDLLVRLSPLVFVQHALEVAGIVNDEAIADVQVQFAGEIHAHQQAVAAQIVGAGHDVRRKVAHVGLHLGRDAAKIRAGDPAFAGRFRFSTDHYLAEDEGSDRPYVLVRQHLLHDHRVVCHEHLVVDVRVVRVNLEVGVEAENAVAQLLVEAAHHADDDDQHRHAERDAEYGDEGDDGDEGPFGAQIPQRQQQFKRQP